MRRTGWRQGDHRDVVLTRAIDRIRSRHGVDGEEQDQKDDRQKPPGHAPVEPPGESLETTLQWSEAQRPSNCRKDLGNLRNASSDSVECNANP